MRSLQFRNFALGFSLFILMGFLFESCETPIPEENHKLTREFSHKVITDWNETYLILERYADLFRPCPTARALGYISFAVYETCLPGMPDYQSMRHQIIEIAPGDQIPVLEDRTGINYPIAVNQVYAHLMRRFFDKVVWKNYSREEAMKLIDETESKLLQSLSKDVQDNANKSKFINNSQAWGNEVARAVWNWAETDEKAKSAHFSTADARPHTNGEKGPNRWQSANPTVAGLFPYWGETRAFALRHDRMLINPPAFDMYTEAINS
ncbi:MAG TPA: hypothetical protein PK006_12855, partial [Saprospiraceae bacterium]|nr:hypothetical protein [Saprospiraceae bacterium]